MTPCLSNQINTWIRDNVEGGVYTAEDIVSIEIDQRKWQTVIRREIPEENRVEMITYLPSFWLSDLHRCGQTGSSWFTKGVYRNGCEQETRIHLSIHTHTHTDRSVCMCVCVWDINQLVNKSIWNQSENSISLGGPFLGSTRLKECVDYFWSFFPTVWSVRPET